MQPFPGLCNHGREASAPGTRQTKMTKVKTKTNYFLYLSCSSSPPPWHLNQPLSHFPGCLTDRRPDFDRPWSVLEFYWQRRQPPVWTQRGLIGEGKGNRRKGNLTSQAGFNFFHRLLPAKTSPVWRLVVGRAKGKRSPRSEHKVPINGVTVTLVGRR